jgi:hypothetical protein
MAFAGSSGSMETLGLRCISSKPFPAPAGTVAIPIPGAAFELSGKTPPGWDIQDGGIVAAADAPQGKAYCQIRAGKGGILRTPRDIAAQPGRPYFLSMWLKSPAEHPAVITFTSEERLRSFGAHDTSIPATGNQWKRVGFYFWMPVPCKTIQFHISPRGEGRPGEVICVDDIQLRTATEAEMSDAYDAQRAHLPPCDISPRPDDGSNLALSVAKWEGRAGVPGKPFVIWAVGSSFTACQRDGYGLMQAIRKCFPHAPEIQYRRHDGGGTPWDYARGWVQQFVVPDQPDLIFTYTPGTPEALDAMLTEIRRHTTADVIVPSVHFPRNSKMTPEDIENGFTSWTKAREICRKHKAEFVENRRELAEYLNRNGMEPAALLQDEAHQSLDGCVRIWDNVGRHINRPAQFSYTPESRERRVAVDPPTSTATEHVELSGSWTKGQGRVSSGQAGSRLKVRFTGNRIDLLGRTVPGGGNIKVLIDGTPADQAPVFYTTFIEPKLKGWPRGQRGQPGDNAPHAVDLGMNVVPQTWTITMTSDMGDYRIAGSVTGADGEGNVGRPFRSKTGQIGIDPKLWRNGRVEKPGQAVWYGNRTGDTFTFDVYRCARGEVSFRSEKAGTLAEPLVQNLPNGPHTLELVEAGDGEVNIEGLYVFQPPEQKLVAHYRGPEAMPAALQDGRPTFNRVRFFPAPGREQVMLGGRFCGSNVSARAGFEPLVEITSVPAAGQWTELSFTNPKLYRWIRYEAPPGSHGNVAELEFYLGERKAVGRHFGSFGWRGMRNWPRAIDGKTDTWFDSDVADGQYVGLDVGDQGSTRSPRMDPPPGEQKGPLRVALFSATPGAVIRYSFTECPGPGDGMLYKEPIPLSRTTTFFAMAFKEGLAPSSLACGTYLFDAQPGLHTVHIGNSLTQTTAGFEQFARAAGYLHTYKNTTQGGGNTKTVSNDPALMKAWQQILADAPTIDHFTVQPRFAHFQQADFDDEVKYDLRFFELVRTKFPRVQPWIYAEWPARKEADRSSGWTPVYDSQMNKLYPTLTYEESSAALLYYIEVVQRKMLETCRGALQPRILPCTLAAGWIKNWLDHGKIPGLSAQDFDPVMFGDNVHPDDPGRYLIDLTWFAAFYRQSPVGKIPPVGIELKANQAEAIQRLAWNVVKNYPDCGLYEDGTTPCGKPEVRCNGKTIVLTSATPGAWFRYTLDGATPTRTRGYVYCGVITLQAGMKLKAVAYKSGMADSEVVEASYPNVQRTLQLPRIPENVVIERDDQYGRAGGCPPQQMRL